MVVQQLLQNGRMTDDQFKQLGQMASQILKKEGFKNYYLVKNVVPILAKEEVFIFLERIKYYGKRLFSFRCCFCSTKQ